MQKVFLSVRLAAETGARYCFAFCVVDERYMWGDPFANKSKNEREKCER